MGRRGIAPRIIVRVMSRVVSTADFPCQVRSTNDPHSFFNSFFYHRRYIMLPLHSIVNTTPLSLFQPLPPPPQALLSLVTRRWVLSVEVPTAGFTIWWSPLLTFLHCGSKFNSANADISCFDPIPESNTFSWINLNSPAEVQHNVTSGYHIT